MARSRFRRTLWFSFGLAATANTVALAAASPAMFRYTPAHTADVAGPSLEFAGLAWHFSTGGAVRSTPAVAEGYAVFGSNDGFLYAVDVKSGAEKWRRHLGGDVSSSPAIAEGKVLVLAADGRLSALRLADGSPVWTMAMGADLSLGGDPRTFDLWASSPTVVGDTVFVGGGDGGVYAVDLASGACRWQHATKSRVRSTPAVDQGTVYVGSFDGNVYALDAGTGAERWEFPTGDAVQSSPAVWDGTVFVGSRSTAVYALDARTGALRWRRVHSGSWILASPAVAAGAVIIGGSDSHRIEALDAKTGRPVWSTPVGARVLGSVVVTGDTVLYGAEDFRVYTLDLATGLGRSIEVTEGAIYSSAVIADGLVLAGSDDRRLYAFNTRPAPAANDTAAPALLRAAKGRYRTADGQEFTLEIQHGRLALAHCTYPPALVIVQADGSFACPMLFGLTGRMRREPGQPVSALAMNLFGRETVAARLDPAEALRAE